jgi:Protein of unknown function (DUF5656)
VFMAVPDKYRPDSNRLGLVTSTVLLALALTRIIPSPGFNFELQLPGFLLSFPFNTNTIMALLTACLTATGMDWLLRGHPSLNNRTTFQWWFLPTLTTFVISLPLSLLPEGRAWWIGFLLSSLFLYFVFLAEYIAVDSGAPYYSASMVGLTAVAYTLFFVLAVALRTSGIRLFLIIPALFLAAFLASLRILHLHLSGRWEFAWAVGIALICIQLAAGLYYWPLSPIQFGLFLVGPLYGLVNLATNLGESIPSQRAVLEPVIVTALCWGLAIVIR